MFATAVFAAGMSVFTGRSFAGGCVAVSIVRAVETGTFEDNPGAGADLAFQRFLPAFRTHLQMIFRHLLKFVKTVTTFIADIFVRWHFSDLSNCFRYDITSIL